MTSVDLTRKCASKITTIYHANMNRIERIKAKKKNNYSVEWKLQTHHLNNKRHTHTQKRRKKIALRINHIVFSRIFVYFGKAKKILLNRTLYHWNYIPCDTTATMLHIVFGHHSIFLIAKDTFFLLKSSLPLSCFFSHSRFSIVIGFVVVWICFGSFSLWWRWDSVMLSNTIKYFLPLHLLYFIIFLFMNGMTKDEEWKNQENNTKILTLYAFWLECINHWLISIRFSFSKIPENPGLNAQLPIANNVQCFISKKKNLM